MNLDQAVNLLQANGCTVTEVRHRDMLVTDPNGNEFRLTDNPNCYTCVATELSMTRWPPTR